MQNSRKKNQNPKLFLVAWGGVAGGGGGGRELISLRDEYK